jgi:N-methylhydantoinase B
MTVKDGSLHFDFTGSDPQLESSLNIPTGGDERHTLLCVGLVYALYSLDTSLFLNSGIARILSSTLPEGTMINPQFPAAVGMRTLSAKRLQGVILGAFARALPDTMPAAAASGGPIMNVNTTDNRTGRRLMAAINPMVGGAGGRAQEDGADGSGANQGFLKNTPVEINEAEVPVKILRYGLAQDSGGAGRYRGGGGTTLEFEVSAPDSVVTARNRDRTRFTPWGSQGGHAGKPSAFVLNPGTSSRSSPATSSASPRPERAAGATRSTARPSASPRTCGAASSPPRWRARNTASSCATARSTPPPPPRSARRCRAPTPASASTRRGATSSGPGPAPPMRG